LEREKGIEPSSSAWEADILPLNHSRPVKRVHFRSIDHFQSSLQHERSALAASAIATEVNVRRPFYRMSSKQEQRLRTDLNLAIGLLSTRGGFHRPSQWDEIDAAQRSQMQQGGERPGKQRIVPRWIQTMSGKASSRKLEAVHEIQIVLRYMVGIEIPSEHLPVILQLVEYFGDGLESVRRILAAICLLRDVSTDEDDFLRLLESQGNSFVRQVGYVNPAKWGMLEPAEMLLKSLD
jgi:hypothetical protein